MAIPRPRFPRALAAVAAVALFALAATPAVGSPPRLAAAVAVGAAAKPSGLTGVCAQRARRTLLRAAARRRRAGTARRTRRRVQRRRRRCAARTRPGNSRGGRTSLPDAGLLALSIDGGYTGWSEEETAERAALGAAITRHEWDPAEPAEAQDDVVLSAAATIHTRIHALLGANELGGAGHYREWVVAFIRRYGVGGSFWSEHPELDESRYAMRTFELGNEPYFGGMSASEYADTVRPTLEEVKRLGLPAELILPSRVYGTDTSWMDTLYQRIPDLNSLFYAFADHPYWYGHDPGEESPAGPFGRIDELRRGMNAHGADSKPIFITEYGESTASCGSECVSEPVQAEHLGEMIDAVASKPEWGVEMLSVFQLRDRGTGSSDRELQFGLLRQDGVEKPSYAIVRAAVQRYRG